MFDQSDSDPGFDLLFTLRKPELVKWERDEDFNPRVSAILFAAHYRLQSITSDTDPRPAIEAELEAFADTPISRRQQMWLYYLLARCADARDFSDSNNFYSALEYLARAENIGLTIQDFGAVIDALNLQGAYQRAVSQYREAADSYDQALRYLREHASDFASKDPDFEVELAGRAAMTDILIGNYERARTHVFSAATLLPLTKDPQGAGNLAWSFALLSRQSGEPLEAYQRIWQAVLYYRQLPPSNSRCRVLVLAAEIAMDATEAQPADATGYLQRATEYLREAEEIGAQAEDEPGLELLKLSRFRWERLTQATNAADAEARIGEALSWAREHNDESLLFMAQTAIGVELLEAGQPDAGRTWLTRAVATARNLRTPGLAYYAQRKLRDMKP